MLHVPRAEACQIVPGTWLRVAITRPPAAMVQRSLPTVQLWPFANLTTCISRQLSALVRENDNSERSLRGIGFMHLCLHESHRRHALMR